MPAHDLAAIRKIYELPLPELLFRAQETHRRHHDPAAVQLCTLQSIKTGRCPEDCKYCPQSAHYNTGLDPEPLMDTNAVLSAARAAREGGASRFCMGAAWREVRDGAQFDSVLDAVRGVSALGLEVCCTLGMLTEPQAGRLKEAGCSVYNHNLDTSREYYPEIITTRTYDDRLATLAAVRQAGLQVCCGGILGMGEAVDDRLKLLQELANLDPQPDSVPINALVPVPGTPLGENASIEPFEFVRIIATARILLPRAMVRLSAGRTAMSDELQALCFIAGANSIFLGDKLLTTPNPERSEDMQLLGRLGMHPLAAQIPSPVEPVAAG
ncbi:MAG TPA: biotin synthase BioB [Opitutaceae bacterium]|jgi:biotin synthase|nr:biotin synthase BioB [Opitutaceae bacterium]